MKKLLLFVILALAPTVVLAQTFLNEDFSGDFPPTGWTGDTHIANWHISGTENSGGTTPEMVFDWDPRFNGTGRILSPRVNLTGITTLKVQFKHMVDHYASPYTIGVATRAGTGAWHVVWQVNPSGNVGPQTLTRDITNGDVGAADFQICWFFTGDSYNIDYWYIDDILLWSPMAHDIKVSSIETESQYDPGFGLAPAVVVENFGTNNETFDVTCKVMMGSTSVYNDTVTGVALDGGQSQTVNFPSFSIPTANELYDVTVVSLLAGDMQPSNDTATTVFNTYTTPRGLVTVEIGTGTWCVYCPGAAMGAEDLIDNGYDVAIVEYHAANGDPFENEYSIARVNYYGISGFPTAVFDGVDKFVGGSNTQSMYQYYAPLVEARADIKSAFSIGVYGEHTNNNYDLTLQVTKNARIPYTNMALHVVLTESGIQYSWQGQTHLEWVERLMLPDANGTTLNFSGGDIQNIELNFTLDPSWVVGECEIAAFVQNLDNKEILQATKVLVPELQPLGTDDDATLPLETRLVGNYPNPFNPSTTIQFSMKEDGPARLEVFNLLGQRITTLVSGQLNAGNHTVIWNGLDSQGNETASGVYFYKLVTDDHASTRKMVLAK
jgi:hypothetical protein